MPACAPTHAPQGARMAGAPVSASAYRLRPVVAGDLPALLPWLRPGAARGLPRPDADAALDAVPAEQWLLVEQQGQARACLRLRRAIGLLQPRPWYHVGCVVHAAPALNLQHRQHTLLLGNDHTGSELADLAWQQAGRSLAEQAAALRALVQGPLARLGGRRSALCRRG
ncbi:hypothetical protein PEC18_39510 [Paucibacter sp. O1-1]|nr:hypothetical protein [Paucibacter sp. O1-1]MDA3831700.1 hypothetical protein [Paucibacter sp. O1-1]